MGLGALGVLDAPAEMVSADAATPTIPPQQKDDLAITVDKATAPMGDTLNYTVTLTLWRAETNLVLKLELDGGLLYSPDSLKLDGDTITDPNLSGSTSFRYTYLHSWASLSAGTHTITFRGLIGPDAHNFPPYNLRTNGYLNVNSQYQDSDSATTVLLRIATATPTATPATPTATVVPPTATPTVTPATPTATPVPPTTTPQPTATKVPAGPDNPGGNGGGGNGDSNNSGGDHDNGPAPTATPTATAVPPTPTPVPPTATPVPPTATPETVPQDNGAGQAEDVALDDEASVELPGAIVLAAAPPPPPSASAIVAGAAEPAAPQPALLPSAGDGPDQGYRQLLTIGLLLLSVGLLLRAGAPANR